MKCHDCSAVLRPHNRTGYCQHCSPSHKCPACGARRQGRGYCPACRAVVARLHELRVAWGDLRSRQHSPPDIKERIARHQERAVLGLPLFA